MFGRKKTIIPMALNQIESEGYHLTIDILVNDKPARLIIDPGASRTVFDETELIELLNRSDFKKSNRENTGIGKKGIESKYTTIQKLTLGALTLENYNVATVDLSGLKQHYKSLYLSPVHGLLGGDLLHEYKAIINYKKLMLTLYLD